MTDVVSKPYWFDKFLRPHACAARKWPAPAQPSLVQLLLFFLIKLTKHNKDNIVPASVGLKLLIKTLI